MFYYGLDSELAKWKSARAQLQHKNGDTQTAIATMQAAMEQAPRNYWLKLDMSQLLFNDGQAAKALQLAEEVLEIDPDSVEALSRKSNCLMHLGRAKEALDTVKEIYEKESGFDPIQELNHLAYFRALAKTEVDLAKAEIDEVITQTSIYNWPDDPPMSLHDQTLLCAGILSHRLGVNDQVMELLDRRIEVFESSISGLTNLFLGSFYQKLLESLPVSKELEENVRSNSQIVEAEKSFLAYLLAIRAVLHQDAGDNDKRDADRAAVEELGLDEEQLLAAMPDEWEALIRLYGNAQFLDTRAMVNLARRKDLRSARQDLNLAVLATELILESFDGQIQNTIQNENGQAFDIEGIKKSQAVMLKHRSDLNRAMGRTEESERDLQRIGELGFTNLASLF